MALLEKVSVESNNIGSTTSAFDEDMPIGADSNGNVYIARDLIGKTILLTYKAEGKDIFFLGQYNENYHWEGYCVINAYYSDGRLYGICESNYDDGKRLDYKTICTSENDEWGYYSRVCNGTINEGVSIEYTFSYNKIADFTTGNVRISDILYADDFLENQDAVMYKFYSGSTADGKYNDDSGNAYRVKFYEDGTVKALYIGQFKNGQRDDDTGNAWDISYNEKLECYKYTTGVFKNGYAENKLGDEISLEQINEIIAEYNFGCELKWKE